MKPAQEGTPRPCNEVPPGNGYCDRCTQGHYEQCRYVKTWAQAKRIEELERQVSYYEAENAHIVTLHARAEQAERALTIVAWERKQFSRGLDKERLRAEQSEALVEQLQGALRDAIPLIQGGSIVLQCKEDESQRECFYRIKAEWLETARALSGHAHAQTATEPKE